MLSGSNIFFLWYIPAPTSFHSSFLLLCYLGNYNLLEQFKQDPFITYIVVLCLYNNQGDDIAKLFLFIQFMTTLNVGFWSELWHCSFREPRIQYQMDDNKINFKVQIGFKSSWFHLVVFFKVYLIKQWPMILSYPVIQWF